MKKDEQGIIGIIIIVINKINDIVIIIIIITLIAVIIIFILVLRGEDEEGGVWDDGDLLLGVQCRQESSLSVHISLLRPGAETRRQRFCILCVTSDPKTPKEKHMFVNLFVTLLESCESLCDSF